MKQHDFKIEHVTILDAFIKTSHVFGSVSFAAEVPKKPQNLACEK